MVVAAGNSSADACDFTPAHVPELLTVGASNSTDTRQSLSNFGGCVDLFAPVYDVLGTSAATATVTGVVALHLQLNPQATPAWLESKILSTATAGILSNIGTDSPNLLLYSDPPLLSVSIVGPNAITSTGTQIWTANGANGAGPYDYTWYRKTDYSWPRGQSTCHYETDWELAGTGATYSEFVRMTDLDFRLRVDVLSADSLRSETASTIFFVTVGDGSQPCPM